MTHGRPTTTELVTLQPPLTGRSVTSSVVVVVVVAVVLAIAVLGSACSFGPSGGAVGGVAGDDPFAPGVEADCGTVRDGVRLVDHAMGTTPVRLRPERVVVLDTGEMDAMDALDLVPVGTVEVGNYVDLPAHVASFAAKATRVGTIAQPNLEAIARLRPDLILGNRVRDEEIYEELSGIGPTVFADDIGPVWRENLLLAATATGRCDEAQAQLAVYDAKVEALRAALGPDRGRLRVSVVRALFGTVRIYGRGSFVGSILDEVGVGRPPAQGFPMLMKEIGLEGIPSMDGDVMFVSSWGPQQPAFDILKGSPDWDALAPVRTGRIFEVDDSTWMLGLGVVGASAVVDDLARLLVATP